MNKARHNLLRGEDVITALGIVQIDAEGFATNLEELGTHAEQVANEIPGFFLIVEDDEPEFDLQGQGAGEGGGGTKTLGGAQDEDTIKKAIADLMAGGAKTNSEGYIDMEVLNRYLREQGIGAISGTKRKALQDALKDG